MSKDILVKAVIYERTIELVMNGVIELDDLECYEVMSHYVNKSGYVSFKRDSFYLLHRWIVWKITGINYPVILHLCDNTRCVNPAHLVGGTQKDNMIDMSLKRKEGF